MRQMPKVLQCPRCGSSRLRRSRTQWYERPRRWVTRQVPHRCVSCKRRGWAVPDALLHCVHCGTPLPGDTTSCSRCLKDPLGGDGTRVAEPLTADYAAMPAAAIESPRRSVAAPIAETVPATDQPRSRSRSSSRSRSRSQSSSLAPALVGLALVAIGIVGWMLTGRSGTRTTAFVGGNADGPPVLALLTSRAAQSSTGDFWYVEGQVRNITEQRLTNIQAVTTWYDAKDVRLSVDNEMIDLKTLLPGQTSPFRTISRFQPNMSRFKVEFQSEVGAPLSVRNETEDMPVLPGTPADAR